MLIENCPVVPQAARVLLHEQYGWSALVSPSSGMAYLDILADWGEAPESQRVEFLLDFQEVCYDLALLDVAV